MIQGREPRFGTDENAVGLDIWTGLPSNFQRWWCHYVSGLGGVYEECSIRKPNSQLSDVTQAQCFYREEIGKLESRTLVRFSDRYLSKPRNLKTSGSVFLGLF